MLVLNSYKLFLKYAYNKNTVRRSHQKFRSKLVRSLIVSAENSQRPCGSTGRAPNEPLERLKGAHYPVYIPCKEDAIRKHPQRECIACNPKSKNQVRHNRKQSIFMCEQCNFSLCIPYCFRILPHISIIKRLLQRDVNENSSSS